MDPLRSADPRIHGADLARAAAIACLVFSIYFIGYSRTLPPTADEMIDFGLAQSIAKWQIFSIDQVSTVGPNPEEFGLGGHRYSKYGPLQALLSVPLFWLAQRLPVGAVDTVLLLNHLVTALTTAVLFLLTRRLGYHPTVGLAVVGLVAFGTPLWVHSKRYFAEPTITLCVVGTCAAAYVAATTLRRRWLLLTGLLFGAAVAAKYVNGVLLLPIPFYLAWSAGRGIGTAGEGARSVAVTLGRAVASVRWFTVGAAPVGALLWWYDVARFGNPLATGYAHWEGFSTPVWVGVAGFLFSPGKSIFVYTPMLLLLPSWTPAFVRRFPAFAATLGAVIALHLGVYGSWWVWWGAWAWGARFIVPILPLLALLLAEGFARLLAGGVSDLRTGVRWASVAFLGGLSVVIQILGISVDHTVYLVHLLPLNPKPDTLTLYDLRYQPILHQIPLLTRQWLDFAWVERSGPSPVNLDALLPALLGAVVGMAGFAIVWRSARGPTRAGALLATAVTIALTTFQALRVYDRSIDPTTAAIVRALDAAPANTAIVQMIPSEVVSYDNWQKRALPELGWIEEPDPNPVIVRRLQRVETRYPRLWVLTSAPPKAPGNGVEAMLDRSLVQVGDDDLGGVRLLRYVTRPARVPFVRGNWRFASGIELTGFAVNGGPIAAGHRFDLTLAWQAGPTVVRRPDYTVFVHLVDDRGRLIAQHDDPPASGYLPTSSWTAGQVIYDDHAVTVPGDAPTGLHLIQVGLYQLSNGQRLPLISPSGRPIGDTVTLDAGQARDCAGGQQAVRGSSPR